MNMMNVDFVFHGNLSLIVRFGYIVENDKFDYPHEIKNQKIQSGYYYMNLKLKERYNSL